MSISPDPTYDIRGALDTLMPGVIIQRNLQDAAEAAYIAKGYQPLASGDVPGILLAANSLDQGGAPYVPTVIPPYPSTLPAYPTGLPRFPDSNETPVDNWSIASNGQVDEGGAPY